MPDTAAPRLVSLNDVCALTSLSRTAINRLRDAEQFPEEVRVGDRRIAFVRDEVDAWINARIEARAGGRRVKPTLH